MLDAVELSVKKVARTRGVRPNGKAAQAVIPLKQTTIELAASGITVTFVRNGDRLCLWQLQREDNAPILYTDPALMLAGSGPVGNPLVVSIQREADWVHHGMETFHVRHLESSERRLLAHLQHDDLPLHVMMEVEVEGHVITWRGQVCWEGDKPAEMEVFYPLLSRVRLSKNGEDRAILPQISGATYGPLTKANIKAAYMGNVSCPVFLIDGENRGLAFLDDNRADFAAEPDGCVRRAYCAGSSFPPRELRWGDVAVIGGDAGPYAGICHGRRFRGRPDAAELDGTDKGAFDVDHRSWMGDYVDLGPIQTYAYEGSWREGASWLREKRASAVRMRQSPAQWYRQTTFIAEDMGDDLVKQGRSFHAYQTLLEDKRRMGADLFHLPGFHDPVTLGTNTNWLNRGDYVMAAQNLGGFDAVKRGVETVHRAGGRVLYYVEGLIVWKRSRIGKSAARDWALMREPGVYEDHYRGFWHMCPACEGWQQWLADTCAEVVRSTGVDGFFIDSTAATYNHRCHNPAHKHPHPDVWNWGTRRLLERVRRAVDEVNPETILFCEGVSDLAREFVDGFISHGHSWSNWMLNEPLVRFLHPEMRAFESWSDRTQAPAGRPPEWMHVWNSVNGTRIYAHNAHVSEMEALSRHTRRYYDAYPEICDNVMSALAVPAQGCISQLYEGAPPIVTVGNLTDQPCRARITLPVAAGSLFNRVGGQRTAVIDRNAELNLTPWQFQAFEVRR